MSVWRSFPLFITPDICNQMVGRAMFQGFHDILDHYMDFDSELLGLILSRNATLFDSSRLKRSAHLVVATIVIQSSVLYSPCQPFQLSNYLAPALSDIDLPKCPIFKNLPSNTHFSSQNPPSIRAPHHSQWFDDFAEQPTLVDFELRSNRKENQKFRGQ